MSFRQIKSIHFENYKVLRDATLPLGRFTLIVGPNGSGKSTAMQALAQISNKQEPKFDQVKSVGVAFTQEKWVRMSIEWEDRKSHVPQIVKTILSWHSNGSRTSVHEKTSKETIAFNQAGLELQ